MTMCLILDDVVQSSPPHNGTIAMSGVAIIMSGVSEEELPQPASSAPAAARASASARRVIPSLYYGQCVVHTVASQASVTWFIAHVLPSSALSGCAAQPHAGQVSSHVCSAALNVSRW